MFDCTQSLLNSSAIAELSIEHRIKRMNYTMFIHVAYLPALLECSQHDWGIRVGASVSISSFTELLRHHIKEQPQHKVGSWCENT